MTSFVIYEYKLGNNILLPKTARFLYGLLDGSKTVFVVFKLSKSINRKISLQRKYNYLMKKEKIFKKILSISRNWTFTGWCHPKSAMLTSIWSQWPHTRIEVVEGEVTWVLWPFAITMHTHIAPILLGKLLKAPSTVTRSPNRREEIFLRVSSAAQQEG